MGCSQEFMPKQQIFTVMLFIRECVSNFKITFNLKREIQLWLSNLVKQVTDFAQCQREFFMIKNMPFSDFYVTRLPLNRG